MKTRLLASVVAAFIVFAGLGLAVAIGIRTTEPPADSPRAHLEALPAAVDHSAFFTEAFTDPHAVTRACLKCHPQEAKDFMRTSHWTWAGQVVRDPDTDKELHIGKRNLINNFCIALAGNWPGCTACHAGYGWRDMSFDFQKEDNVDCLVCHDTTGTYFKKPGDAGYPLMKTVDLLAVAKGVGWSSTRNCGICHFNGGGGNAVKHGDMDSSMNYPTARIDVHMGKYGFTCQTCHKTKHHDIPGAAMSISTEKPLRVFCTDCHKTTPHHDARLNTHTRTVACETCHIPRMAIDDATKMTWDWGQAGKTPAELKESVPQVYEEFLKEWNPPESVRSSADFEKASLERFAKYLEENHIYLKIKGLFTFAKDVPPEFYWYNGRSVRYLTGQKIDPSEITAIARPLGSVKDPEAKIHPFKVHRARQPYDKKNLTLLTPKLYGKDGFWKTFDWPQALRLGAEASGLPFSGEYGFTRTDMWWPLSHMVAPKDRALRCAECHGDTGRMDWNALGYDADPAYQGTRLLMKMPSECKKEQAEN